MKLLTSDGKTYAVDWIDGPTITTGRVVLQMQDSRNLSEIAADFEGLAWMKRENEEQGDKLFEGYSELVNVARKAGDLVILTFDKP